MQPWFTVALFVSVLAPQALGLPRASPESDGLELPTNQSGEDKPEDLYPKLNAPIEEQKRFSRDSQLSAGQAEGRVERGLETDVKPLEDSPIKVTFPEDSKSGMLKEEDDGVRAKKSTSSRDAPHLTTVCIQVRSDHPSVVCGPQVDDGKDQKFIPGARSSLGDHNMFYREPLPLYGRSSQAPGLIPSQLRYMQALSPKTIPSSPNNPSAANGPTGFQVMRSEDQTIDAHPPSAASGQPGRGGPQIINQGIPAGSAAPGTPVTVHNSAYKPLPVGYPGAGGISPYSTSSISPFSMSGISPFSIGSVQPNALRLNCLSDYTPWGGPTLRSASQQPQFVQIGDQLVAIPGPSARMAQDSLLLDNPNLYFSQQARSAHPDQMVGAPFGFSALDSLLGNTFIAENGQAYFIDDSQARVASDEQALRNILDFQSFQRMAPSEILKNKEYEEQKKMLDATKEDNKKLQDALEKMQAEKEKSQKELEHLQEDSTEKKKSDGSTKKRQAKNRS